MYTKAVLNYSVLYQNKQSNVEKKLGLMNPVPDQLWDLKIAHHPPRDAPKLSETAKALPMFGHDLAWAAFAMEEKSADDTVGAAENQAIRSAFVGARRPSKTMVTDSHTKGFAKKEVGVNRDYIAFSCS